MFKISKYDLLFAVYLFCIIASELMGGKTFYLFDINGFKLNASVAIFLLPMIFTINDIIVETSGKEKAQSMVRSSLVVIIMLILFSLLATSLPPSARFLPNEKAYDSIFNISIRFSLASLAAFTVAEFTDIFIFNRIRVKMGKKSLWLRNNVSNFLAQFIDTSLFSILAFYSFAKGPHDNLIFISGIVIPYWLLKCLMSIFGTPFVYLGTAWLKAGKVSK